MIFAWQKICIGPLSVCCQIRNRDTHRPSHQDLFSRLRMGHRSPSERNGRGADHVFRLWTCLDRRPLSFDAKFCGLVSFQSSLSWRHSLGAEKCHVDFSVCWICLRPMLLWLYWQTWGCWSLWQTRDPTHSSSERRQDLLRLHQWWALAQILELIALFPDP